MLAPAFNQHSHRYHNNSMSHDASNALHTQRRGLDDWRRKKQQLRLMVEGLEHIQRRSIETRRRIDAALHRISVNEAQRHTEPSQAIALQSPSPPQELTTCATQTLLDDAAGGSVGSRPPSFARLVARSRSALESPPSDWAMRRNELRKFFDSDANAIGSHDEYSEPPGKHLAYRKDRDRSVKHDRGVKSGIGGVVGGIMAAAMPRLVDNAQRMRKAADRLKGSRVKSDPNTPRDTDHTNSPKSSRDDVLLDRCRALFAANPKFACLDAPLPVPLSRVPISVRLCMSDADGEMHPQRWSSGDAVLEAGDAPRYLWILHSPHDDRVSNPTCLDIGAWRGHVLADSSGPPFCISLRARYPHSSGHPITHIKLEMASFEEMENFVESVKRGQRRIAAEWHHAL
jgi:hypothetical protein